MSNTSEIHIPKLSMAILNNQKQELIQADQQRKETRFWENSY